MTLYANKAVLFLSFPEYHPKNFLFSARKMKQLRNKTTNAIANYLKIYAYKYR
jgi:hypothetical protein